jgi:hypothetical protein
MRPHIRNLYPKTFDADPKKSAFLNKITALVMDCLLQNIFTLEKGLTEDFWSESEEKPISL